MRHALVLHDPVKLVHCLLELRRLRQGRHDGAHLADHVGPAGRHARHAERSDPVLDLTLRSNVPVADTCERHHCPVQRDGVDGPGTLVVLGIHPLGGDEAVEPTAGLLGREPLGAQGHASPQARHPVAPQHGPAQESDQGHDRVGRAALDGHPAAQAAQVREVEQPDQAQQSQHLDVLVPPPARHPPEDLQRGGGEDVHDEPRPQVAPDDAARVPDEDVWVLAVRICDEKLETHVGEEDDEYGTVHHFEAEEVGLTERRLQGLQDCH
mmetsp:Transcript_62894/g.175884  ORF Transcript_62894/g.175884 Transcript_62894/m.175884 type:complete len:267 (+) Transcript_62894:1130-1930(+)